MPALSFIFSALLVGSAVLYSYLSHSQKIEEAKQKIEEKRKVEFLSKKNELSKLSIHDTENLSLKNSNVRFTAFVKDDYDSQIQEYVALLKSLQTAVDKLILEDKVENPTCEDVNSTGILSYESCVYIKDKNISFYDFQTFEDDKSKEVKLQSSLFHAKAKTKKAEQNILQHQEKLELIEQTKDYKALSSLALRSAFEPSIFRTKLLSTISEHITSLKANNDLTQAQFDEVNSNITKANTLGDISQTFTSKKIELIDKFDVVSIHQHINFEQAIYVSYAQNDVNKQLALFINALQQCKETQKDANNPSLTTFQSCVDTVFTNADNWIDNDAQGVLNNWVM
jgi:hypothetical protein